MTSMRATTGALSITILACGIYGFGCDPDTSPAESTGSSANVATGGGAPHTAEDYAHCLPMNGQDCQNCCAHAVPTKRWEDYLEQCQCGSCPECNCTTYNNEPSCYACMDAYREHCLGVAHAACSEVPDCALQRQCKEECPEICKPCSAFQGSHPPCDGSQALHDALMSCACERTSADDPPGCAEWCAGTGTCDPQWPRQSGCEDCLYGTCEAEKEACDADQLE